MIYYTAWNDIRDLAELYKEWTGKDLDMSKPSSNVFLVVAKDDTKVVGAAQVIVICDQVWGRDWGLVENVYVSKDYRGQGVGKGLMHFIESQFLVSTICAFIKLTSRKEEGKALYRSLDYIEGAAFRKER